MNFPLFVTCLNDTKYTWNMHYLISLVFSITPSVYNLGISSSKGNDKLLINQYHERDKTAGKLTVRNGDDGVCQKFLHLWKLLNAYSYEHGGV